MTTSPSPRVHHRFHAFAVALTVAGTAITFSSAAHAQTAKAATPTPPLTGTAEVDAVLDSLRQPDPDKWWEGVGRLNQLFDRDSALLDNPAVYETVVALVRSETAVIDANFRNGVSTDEGFGEDYSVMLETATRVLRAGAPDTRRALLAALVKAVYNPDSRFAKELASYGELVVEPALELTHTDMDPDRWNAYAMLGEILRADRTHELKVPLATGSAARLRVALRGGLRDPEIVTRRETVNAIVAAEDREAIPLLKELAASDPDVGAGLTQRFSVRALAAAAVEKLQRVR